MATYVLNDEKMFSDIADGIAIVINSETGIYYGMNNFGTAVFENILNGVSTDDILKAVTDMPGAPKDVEDTLSAFISELVAFEIVKEGPGNGAVAVNLDLAAIQEDAFSLAVQEYSDAQELLLADPIHEVKEDTGWQPDIGALETNAEVVADKHKKMER